MGKIDHTRTLSIYEIYWSAINNLGCSLKIKMTDHLIQCSIFSVKHDCAFNFLINQVFFVNKPVTKNLEIATSGNTGLNFVSVYELSALLMSLFIPSIQITETNLSKKAKNCQSVKEIIPPEFLINQEMESTIIL